MRKFLFIALVLLASCTTNTGTKTVSVDGLILYLDTYEGQRYFLSEQSNSPNNSIAIPVTEIPEEPKNKDVFYAELKCDSCSYICSVKKISIYVNHRF